MNAAAIGEFARIGFLNMLAFRLRYYTGVITYLINVTIYAYIWKALYDSGGGVAGLSYPEMLTYVGVGWMIRSMYFNNVDVELAQDILEGKIVMTMLRPASVQLSYVSRVLGESTFRLLLLTAPTALVVSLLFPMRGPASAAHAALFALAMLASILIVAFLNFAVGSFALLLTSILGLLRAKFWMMELASGLLVPVTLFPAPARLISRWLPFEHIGYTPMMIYLGKLPVGESAARVAIAFLWVGLLAGGGALLWNRLSRKITVHGG